MSGILIALSIWAIGFMIWAALLIYAEVVAGPTNAFRLTLAYGLIWPYVLIGLIVMAARELLDRVVPR